MNYNDEQSYQESADEIEPVYEDVEPDSSVEEDPESEESNVSNQDEDGDKNVKMKLLTGGKGYQAPNAERVTPNFLTKYEKARVIGTRALQISKNAPVLVDLGKDDIDPILIAEKELAEGKLPFVIRRYLPNGTFEDWRVSDLQLIDRF